MLADRSTFAFVYLTKMATTSLQDLKTKKFWLALVAEFLGTMLLVLVACGACGRFKVAVELDTPAAVSNNQSSEAAGNTKLKFIPHDLVQISLAFGLSVATIVWSIAHVSGGHINPGVTIGFLVTRKISLVRALLYIGVQTVGAVMGAVVLKLVSPAGVNDGLGTTSPGAGMTIGMAFIVETIITFVLVWTVFSTCDAQRTDLNGSGPLAIGLSIAMCHLWAVGYVIKAYGVVY